MIRRFCIFLPCKPNTPGAQTIKARGDVTTQIEKEMLINLNMLARILEDVDGNTWLVMRDGTSWLSAIGYEYLADALDGVSTNL